MGIIAEFFVANATDAVQYESFLRNNSFPKDRYDGAISRKLTPLTLEILWSIIERREWDTDTY